MWLHFVAFWGLAGFSILIELVFAVSIHGVFWGSRIRSICVLARHQRSVDYWISSEIGRTAIFLLKILEMSIERLDKS